MRKVIPARTRGLYLEKPGERLMTTRSANRTGGLILTSLLWMTGFSFVASAPYGAHAEQHNPARAATFGYVANTDDNTISVIATNNNTVVATIPVGSRPFGVATTPDGTHAYVTNSNDAPALMWRTLQGTTRRTSSTVPSP
jgi:YVTN family beta-propeller protein